MSNPFFRFKQFTVWHDQCAMKTGTDGTLLGAWVNVDGCRNVLDVGTGTGLIALMIAQRNQVAQIEGIDIERDACMQAAENVALSPFAKQIRIQHASLQAFADGCNQRFDLIVSNPPYFVQSLGCPEPKRQLARHNNSLMYADLLNISAHLLSSGGRIALILPFQQKNEIIRLAEVNQLYCIRMATVCPVANTPAKRLLVEFSNLFPHFCEKTYLVLEDKQHQRTKVYQDLMQEFYL